MNDFKLEKDVNQVSGSQPVVTLGQMDTVHSGVENAGIVRQHAFDIDSGMRPQFGVIQAGESGKAQSRQQAAQLRIEAVLNRTFHPRNGIFHLRHNQPILRCRSKRICSPEKLAQELADHIRIALLSGFQRPLSANKPHPD
jgi:hypothetical protein